MRHLAKEVWLTAQTTIFATTQTTFQIAKERVKLLQDSNAHLQMNSPQMLSPENSCHTQDFLFQVSEKENNVFIIIIQQNLTYSNGLYILFSFVGDDYAYIVCVGYEPRIQYCGDGTVFDPQVLTCVYAGPPHGVPSGPGFGPF